jgi:hypothetical protein
MRAPKIRKIGSRDSTVSLSKPALAEHLEEPVRHACEPALPEEHLREPVWHVWIEGGDPVGPVSADQIARGIQAGKVPSHASVRHEMDTFWGDLLDAPDIVSAIKAVSAETEPPPPSMSPALAVRQFMVWVPGCDPVGPVSADQVARGIRAGKVPTEANIQRVGDLFASDVLDEPDVIAALKAL